MLTLVVVAWHPALLLVGAGGDPSARASYQYMIDHVSACFIVAAVVATVPSLAPPPALQLLGTDCCCTVARGGEVQKRWAAARQVSASRSRSVDVGRAQAMASNVSPVVASSMVAMRSDIVQRCHVGARARGT